MPCSTSSEGHTVSRMRRRSREGIPGWTIHRERTQPDVLNWDFMISEMYFLVLIIKLYNTILKDFEEKKITIKGVGEIFWKLK